MLCPDALAASITAAAVTLSKDRSTEDIDILSATFMQLGDTLATIAAARAKCEKVKNID